MEGTDIVTFNSDLQKQVDDFFEKCFFAVGIPYSPKDRHADVANVQQHYMNNGCFWCLLDDDKMIGTIAIRRIDDVNMIGVNLSEERYGNGNITSRRYS